MTRRYEVVYIFDSALDEAAVNAHLEKFHELLKSPDHPTPVTNVNHWGKRTLAFPVKKREQGYYAIVQFETQPNLLPEFERAIKLDDSVIRFLVVVNEGEPPRAPTVRAGSDDDGPMVPAEERDA
jgi:small subunit ribosomal protein S6